jgi:hypothetical protein
MRTGPFALSLSRDFYAKGDEAMEQEKELCALKNNKIIYGLVRWKPSRELFYVAWENHGNTRQALRQKHLA